MIVLFLAQTQLFTLLMLVYIFFPFYRKKHLSLVNSLDCFSSTLTVYSKSFTSSTLISTPAARFLRGFYEKESLPVPSNFFLMLVACWWWGNLSIFLTSLCFYGISIWWVSYRTFFRAECVWLVFHSSNH